jgi:hypothetical protein
METKSVLEKLNIKIMAPIIAIIISIYTLFDTVRSSEFKNSLQKIDSTSKKLNNIRTETETRIKEQDFNNQLKFKLFEEVKYAVNNKSDKNDELVTLMVYSLLDSTEIDFQKSLLSLLQTKESEVITNLTTKNSSFIDVQNTELEKDKTNIDVFYLDDMIQESKIRATQIVDILKKNYPNSSIRLRLLPKTVNVQSGYRIDSNQIRYEKETEESLALKIKALVDNNKVFQKEKLILHPVRNKTPNYISIFVRNM